MRYVASALIGAGLHAGSILLMLQAVGPPMPPRRGGLAARAALAAATSASLVAGIAVATAVLFVAWWVVAVRGLLGWHNDGFTATNVAFHLAIVPWLALAAAVTAGGVRLARRLSGCAPRGCAGPAGSAARRARRSSP